MHSSSPLLPHQSSVGPSYFLASPDRGIIIGPTKIRRARISWKRRDRVFSVNSPPGSSAYGALALRGLNLVCVLHSSLPSSQQSWSWW